MGSLNTECPNCGDEGAYHNGQVYECPNCDYTWSEVEDDIDNED